MFAEKKFEDPRKHLIVDGVATENPGGSLGWACVNGLGEVVHKGSRGSSPVNTSPRAELHAMISALEHVPSGDGSKGWLVESRSRYAVFAITRGWLRAWEARRYKTSDGIRVKNRDLMEHLARLIEDKPHVEIVWSQGLTGHPLRQLADRHANRAAREG